jgi:hypothetical protein
LQAINPIPRNLIRKYYKAGYDSAENRKIIYTEDPVLVEKNGVIFATNPAFIAFHSGKRKRMDELNQIKYDPYELVV